jgi:hypothetical protein
MDQLHTSADVIDALGGPDAVVALTRRSHKTVWRWRKHGFPPGTYLTIQNALAAVSKTAPASLWWADAAASKETVAA